MFLGQFYHNIDEKGRLTVPARFREQLNAEQCILMKGFDQNLILITASIFDILSQKLSVMSLTDRESRLLKRLIFSTANPVELDRAGRILVPQFLRAAVGLESEAVVVGVGDYIEIWSADEWSKQTEQINDAQLNADRFSALDLATR
jgi:MraZ protein